jgi:predicted dehydrogenase
VGKSIFPVLLGSSSFKREEFVRKFMRREGSDGEAGKEQQSFRDWRDWKEYEVERRRRQEKSGDEGAVVEKGVDAVFVCVLDELHEEVVCGIADMGLHVCCEKPMSTSLESCMKMYEALRKGAREGRETVFGICHVLRYSQHNMLLRHLLLEKEVIGDVMSIEHVEPIGWWHYSHSYVRYVNPMWSAQSTGKQLTHDPGEIGGKSPRLHRLYLQSRVTTLTF